MLPLTTPTHPKNQTPVVYTEDLTHLIAAVQFECARCHSLTEWPLDVAKRPPTRCHCDDQQWMMPNGETETSISHLLSLIQRFAKAQNEGYVMRFGLKQISVSDRASGDKG